VEMIPDCRDDLVLVIPATAGMTREAAEALRKEVRARFEELDPGTSEPRKAAPTTTAHAMGNEARV
jgi:hypothetical protein